MQYVIFRYPLLHASVNYLKRKTLFDWSVKSGIYGGCIVRSTLWTDTGII